MQDARILVVSTHSIVRHAVAEVLRRESRVGEVQEAQTGQEALEWARAWRPDIVLIEVRLPDLSGLGIARQLKKLPSTLHVVLLTRDGVEIYRDILQVFKLDAAIDKRHFVKEFRMFLEAFEQDSRKQREPRSALRVGTVSRDSGVREKGWEH